MKIEELKRGSHIKERIIHFLEINPDEVFTFRDLKDKGVVNSLANSSLYTEGIEKVRVGRSFYYGCPAAIEKARKFLENN